MKLPTRAVLASACALSALVPAAAQAAPVTVQLRIEGATSTLFEGPVTTDVRAWKFTDQATEYACDGQGANNSGGTSPVPAVTRGAVLRAASDQHGFSMKGSFNSGYGSPTFTEIVGANVAYDNDGTGRYLVEFLNKTGTDLGACAQTVQHGDEVLFAFTGFGSGALALTGPATAKPGQPFAVKVTDGAGAAIDGAAVGGTTTDGAGAATVTLTQRGPQTLKADKPGVVRSNALAVCVSDGADGYCGNPTPSGQLVQGGGTTTPFVADRTAPKARVAGIKRGQTFSRAKAPKLLEGAVDEAGGVLMVKLRLTRNDKGRCSAYSAKRERFIRRPKCGADHGWWFKVGDQPDWEYQLASKLPRGRYVLDVNVIDKAYNRDDARRPGENRVVFKVR